MANPGQPDLHDNDDLGGAPIPDDNLPGHHPEVEQDKPSLDAFAEKLGIVPEADEDTGGSARRPQAQAQAQAQGEQDDSPRLPLERVGPSTLRGAWTVVADVVVLPALGLVAGTVEVLEDLVSRTRDPDAARSPLDSD